MPTTRITVDEYEQMIESGVLTEKDRVVLIRGEVVPKMSIGTPHSACVKRLNDLVSSRKTDRFLVGVQDPIRLPDSEPEPDLTLLRRRDDFYLSGHPQPDDILLLIEVADSSLDEDREVMRPLYAEAGIREYWIVNLRDQCLEVYRQPQPDGSYREIQILRRGQQVEITALPGLSFAVEDLF
jgi:Uma2 family endonuclease